MSLHRVLSIIAIFLWLTLPATAESPFDRELRAIADQWATIEYQMPAEERTVAFESLGEQSRRLSERHPGRAEALVWEAIIRSSYAGSMSGLRSLFSALPQVTRARDLLHEAEAIDATVLDGAVYTCLGSLYTQVPGFPIGFGDTEKAFRYLRQAIEVSPEGIDANYFMADYWSREGQPSKARLYVERALNAPTRDGRTIADAGRREEARELLLQLESS